MSSFLLLLLLYAVISIQRHTKKQRHLRDGWLFLVPKRAKVVRHRSRPRRNAPWRSRLPRKSCSLTIAIKMASRTPRVNCRAPVFALSLSLSVCLRPIPSVTLPTQSKSKILCQCDAGIVALQIRVTKHLICRRGLLPDPIPPLGFGPIRRSSGSMGGNQKMLL